MINEISLTNPMIVYSKLIFQTNIRNERCFNFHINLVQFVDPAFISNYMVNKRAVNITS